jgi:2',3'-cyclic-nucleotide 2'-phosphodiesterase (5'-nucleotidase family)
MGMGWIAGAIRAQKDKDADTLALDAGDTFHGLPIINISKGANMAQLMNLAGYDAMTPGNHDFNYGAERLHELAGMLNFPMLSANLVDREGKGYVFRPYQSYVMDGVKVAVIGLTTPEVAYKTNPANVQAVKILDPVATAKSGYRNCVRPMMWSLALCIWVSMRAQVTSERIAKEVPGFDVIIDGHSHTQLDKGLMVGQTLICQTGAHGHYLGEVELVVKDHQLRKAQAELLDKPAVQKLAGQQDAGVQTALKEHRSQE